MHGFGVYQFGNGHRYEGAWHEGRKQGLGTYTFRNGETQSGHWQNGVLDPSMQNSHPGSSYAVNHAKVLNAVQVIVCCAFVVKVFLLKKLHLKCNSQLVYPSFIKLAGTWLSCFMVVVVDFVISC